MSLGMLGLILGSFFAGLVYLLIAVTVRYVGVGWLDRLMPPVVIGPTVSIIGLGLARSAVKDLTRLDGFSMPDQSFVALFCGLVTLLVTILCSCSGKKELKLLPFIIGILAGYVLASVFTVIGTIRGIESFKVIDFSVFGDYILSRGTLSFSSFLAVPDFVFLNAFGGLSEISFSYVSTILVAYVPVAFVVFAEHIADHKNLSSVLGRDLLKEPGLHRTLSGDGVGSFVGSLFGGSPNTTYGESIACVAITGHSSSYTILVAAVGCILCSFVTPFIAFVDSIPACVMGGACFVLYGFIAVSGLKMLKNVDFDRNENLFVASAIFIADVGGLTLTVGAVILTSISVALILGIIINIMLRCMKKG